MSSKGATEKVTCHREAGVSIQMAAIVGKLLKGQYFSKRELKVHSTVEGVWDQTELANLCSNIYVLLNYFASRQIGAVKIRILYKSVDICFCDHL